MEAGATTWTPPGITQLVVAATTPLAVVLLGWYITRATKKLESIQWANQSVVSRRLDVFDTIAPKLNLLLCFFTFVGGWKEVTPLSALQMKRDIDEAVYSRRILFSDEMLKSYHFLMTTMFVMYANVDGDALLKARISSELGDRRHLAWWSADLERLFASEGQPSLSAVWEANDAFLTVMRRDLYLTRAEV